VQQRSTANARVIDVSENNGVINWGDVKRTGIVGAWAKATEGATGRDSMFYRNYIGMKAAGLLRGPYCFARPATSTARSEADAFIDRVMAAGGFDSLDPMLDLEDAGGLSPWQLAAFILAWEARVKARTGREIILYSYTAFIREHLAPVVGKINHLRLFLADYGHSVPDVPGWPQWTLLQYSETGLVPGISGHVDLDEFAGSADELRRVCGAGRGQNNMQIGDSGAAAMQLQKDLNQVLGIHLVEDGQYGAKTATAVRTFQQIHHMGTTGVADPATLNAVNAEVAKLDAPKPAPVAATPTQPKTESVPANDKVAEIAQLKILIQQASEVAAKL